MKHAIYILAAILSITASAAQVDPNILALQNQARINAARFVQISRTIHKEPPPLDSNVCYTVRTSFEQRLDGARNLASATITSNSFLRVLNANLYTLATNLYVNCAALSNTLAIVDAQLDAASAKINSEIADLEAKIAKYEEYKTKYPLFKTLWTALINDAEERIKILQALTTEAN